MLSYAYKTLEETESGYFKPEGFEHIHDLFAAILIKGIGTQVKRGLYCDYVSECEAVTGLKGQIKVADTIKKQTRTTGKLICSYDEFTENIHHNQVLKSVMLLLLRQGDVTVENRKLLRKLLLYFKNVSDIHPTEIQWNMLKYSRQNVSYRMLIEICHLVVDGLLLSTEKGERRLSSWLNDDKMFNLFQKFVFAFYDRHHRELLPSASQIEWHISCGEKSKYLPSMKTDIVLKNEAKTMIIDTKYYSKTMQSYHERAKYISSHLYQIYAYVMNHSKGAGGVVSGVLLYAKTDEKYTPDEDLFISGNRISLKTLDLNREWSEITAQLNEICEWVKI